MSIPKTNGLNVQNATATSFLQTVIPVSANSASLPTAILPYVGNLAIGQYESEIVAVDDAIQNDALVGIDCIHQLTDSNGKVITVKFRFFAPTEVDTLKKILSSYGMTGNLGSALLGLKETVDINHRPKSSRYLYISSRMLYTSSASTNSGASANSPSQSSTQSNRTGSYIVSKHSHTPLKSSLASKRATLLQDNEDDEDDDDYCDGVSEWL